MYSLMSILSMAFSSSNKNSASALVSSVLPTPVGPKNKKLPIGLCSSDIPALDLRIAFATEAIALSCPTTLSLILFSTVNSFCFSPCIILSSGMPVIFATTLDISSAVTTSLSMVPSLPPSMSAISFLIFGKSP